MVGKAFRLVCALFLVSVMASSAAWAGWSIKDKPAAGATANVNTEDETVAANAGKEIETWNDCWGRRCYRGGPVFYGGPVYYGRPYYGGGYGYNYGYSYGYSYTNYYYARPAYYGGCYRGCYGRPYYGGGFGVQFGW